MTDLAGKLSLKVKFSLRRECPGRSVLTNGKRPKSRLILDEMCRLYGKFASYLRRVLHKTRLIFPGINGPNVVVAKTSYQMLKMLSFSARERALPPLTEISVLIFW